MESTVSLIFYDLMPVLLFFIVFKFYGIYAATWAGILSTLGQVVITRLIKKNYNKQQVMTLFVFMLMGGLTLYFHNPLFIKWKPTIIFWVLSFVFLGSQCIGKTTMAERMFEKILEDNAHQVPRLTWLKVNTSWSLFFAFLGALNLYVAFHYSLETWVNYKLFGSFTMLMVFSLAQGCWLIRYLPSEK
jgi:intracellular septation protein